MDKIKNREITIQYCHDFEWQNMRLISGAKPVAGEGYVGYEPVVVMGKAEFERMATVIELCQQHMVPHVEGAKVAHFKKIDMEGGEDDGKHDEDAR